MGLLFGRKKKEDPAAELRALFGGHELPTFPAVVVRALDKVRDPDTPTPELADVVSTDPNLSVRVLGLVNSAAAGLRYPVRNVQHAISLLGRGQLESTLISLAVRESLPARRAKGYEMRRFWLTSARRAATARALADRLHPATRSESFTASLLQDMAVPLLAHHQPSYGNLLEHWHHGNEDLAELERAEYPWDHAQVASWMCESWQLPGPLTEAIGAHHGTGPEDAAALPAANLVSLLREVGDELGRDRLIATARDDHGIAEDDTIALLRQSFREAEGIAEMFEG